MEIALMKCLVILVVFLFVWFILLNSAERRVFTSLIIGDGRVPDCPNISAPPQCYGNGLDHVPALKESPYQLLRKGEKIISTTGGKDNG